MPRQLDRQRRFCLGDTIAKFTSSAWMSGCKTGFQRRVRKTLMEFVGEWRTIEPSEGEEAVDCQNNSG